MMMPPSPFKTIASVVFVALALAVVAFGVMPAQAQQGPALNFNLQLPGDSGASRGLFFGFGGDHDAPQAPAVSPRHDGAMRCLSDREVRRGVEDNGYRQVEISRDLPQDRVEVAGQNGNWLYSMRVDRCTGQVDRVERVRRLRGGGFGLQFSFSN